MLSAFEVTVSILNLRQVKQVYNDQLLGILALGKIGGGYGSLVSVVSRVCPWLPRNGPWLSRCGPWLPRWGPLVPRLSPWYRFDPLVPTLWYQIRTARSLLGPVVEYPHVYFCGPCFSLFAPYDFYSGHVFHINPPVVFIQTAFFQNVTSRVLL